MTRARARRKSWNASIAGDLAVWSSFARGCGAFWSGGSFNDSSHLPSKAHVDSTLDHALASLKPSGQIILMGPNIRFLAEKYWDFWDHYIPISHVSIVEALRNRGFEIQRAWPRFLPYTLAGRGRTSFAAACVEAGLSVYLSAPILWPFFGRQFLVVARKPRSDGAVSP